MNGCKQKQLQNGRVLCINQLFAAPLHFVGRYLFPGCLISIFFWVWVLLACWDPDPQKRHHFVRTCCSAISLRFSQLSLRSNPLFLQGTGLSDMCGLSFYNVDKKWSVHTPSSFAQDLCWKSGPARTSGMALHFEFLVVATLLLLYLGSLWLTDICRLFLTM